MNHTHDPRCNQPACHCPGATFDDIAVVRLVSGTRVVSTMAERIAAVDVLTARGRSASWIAAALHVAERSVCRYRVLNRNKRKAAA